MRLRKLASLWLAGVVLVCMGLAFASGPASAQAPAGDTGDGTQEMAGEVAAAADPDVELPAQDRESGFVELFKKGGKFMWALLLLAVVALAVILERAFSLQRAQTNTRKLMSAVISNLKSKGVEAAQEICMRTRGPIAAILHAGLSKVDRGPAAVEKAIENSGAIEMSFLQRGLPVLSTVANIAPLLGFLGTVSGMINAFEAIAAAEQVSAKVVASGISEALITTMSGLVIAIPAQMMYNFYVSRIDRFVIEMEESSVELLDTLTDLESTPAA